MNHIKTWTNIVLLAFLFTSAGVTAVIEVCCVPVELQESSGSQDIENHNEAAHNQMGPIVQTQDDCHQRVIAGGLHDLTAVMQKVNLNGPTSDLAAAVVSHRIPVCFTEPPRSLQNPFFFRDSHSPPVERYVLTSAFLI